MTFIQLAAAAALGLALCTAAQGAPSADPAANLVYTGCSEQTSLLILPVSSMPALPQGFSYVTPAGGGALAEIHLSGTLCESVNGQGGEESVIAFALITPPAYLMVPEVPYYAIALGGYNSRPQSLAQFEAWGIPDLILPAAVNVRLGPLPLVRTGKVKAVASGSSLVAQTVAVGPGTSYPGGRTRAYYIRDGVLLASFDALYTQQASMVSVGTVTVTGTGFLPAGLYPAPGSHASGYDLTVGFVQYY